MKPKLPFFAGIVFILLFTKQSFAQGGLVSVNNFTGTAIVNIPLYNLNRGTLSFPVNAVYSGSGVKVKDVEGSLGMGWQLVAGGAVTRILRGFPDDRKPFTGSTETDKIGWLYNTRGASINSFTITNDSQYNSGTSCTKEAADLSYINTNMGGLGDNEPDIFNVNAPGLNCQLVIDKDHNFKTTTYQDIKIAYTTNTTASSQLYGSITGFTITNDKGITYEFKQGQTQTRIATSSSPATILFSKSDYNYYKTSTQFYNSWLLTKMTDRKNNEINISYTTVPTDVVSVTPVAYYIGNTKTTQYTIKDTYKQQMLASVTDQTEDALYTRATFTFTTNTSTGYSQITSITNSNGVNVNFNYELRYFLESDGTTKYYRNFLESINNDNSSISPLNLHFKYSGSTGTGTDLKTTLPDSTSKNIDYWGYCMVTSTAPTSLVPTTYINPTSTYERYKFTNPGSLIYYPYSIAGVDRSTNETSVDYGSLTKIYYDGDGSLTTTGYTQLEYESNDYIDSIANTLVKGGGIRIKNITDYDGVNSANNIVRNYTYTSGGVSSGKPISLPVFAFTSPTTYNPSAPTTWANETIRSELDLSGEDHSIIYSKVRVTMTGAGYSEYEYTTPGNAWNRTAVPDWTPLKTYMGRATCTAYYDPATLAYAYPFAPEIDYSFERGLLTRVSHYDVSGQLKGKTEYTYQRVGTPGKIYGLEAEVNGSYVTSYTKYPVFIGAGNQVTQEVATVYNSASPYNALSTTTNYTYGSAKHEYPTKIKTTNSDGSILFTNYRYLKDYVCPADMSAADASTKAIKTLQDGNVNMPVEEYKVKYRSPDSAFVSASITEFDVFANTYSPDLTLPERISVMNNTDGYSSFSPSYVSGTGTFTKDSHYYIKSRMYGYNIWGQLLTTYDNSRRTASNLYEVKSEMPIASIANARYDEVAYANYEGANPYSFSYTTGNRTTLSRTGTYGLSITSASVSSITLKKNAYAQAAIFSIWIKSTGSGSLTVTATNSTGLYSVNSVINYANTGGVYKYYETTLPTTASMTAPFTVKFQSSTSLVVDDILFYPDIAEVKTYSNDTDKMIRLTETDTNGMTIFYEYDGYNRLVLLKDMDGNIRYRKKYVKAAL
ncbi:hypothetical protein FFF34_014995 [Inquilinus sp. KBS0705]|nr:hypothetical protein FFF34_014995 [Inquilinus sp. KBS0705]